MDDGKWITTENGHHVHISEEGSPDIGNSHVISKMTSQSGVKLKKLSHYSNVFFNPHTRMNVPQNILDDITDRVVKAVDEFPILDDFLYGINAKKINEFATAECSATGQIHINEDVWKSEKAGNSFYGKTGDKAFMHPQNSTFKDSIYHELGHAIEISLAKKQYAYKDFAKAVKNGDVAKSIMRVAVSNYLKQSRLAGDVKDYKVRQKCYETVSKYAIHSDQEAMAECVCDYFVNGDNCSELSKKVINRLKSVTKSK